MRIADLYHPPLDARVKILRREPWWNQREQLRLQALALMPGSASATAYKRSIAERQAKTAAYAREKIEIETKARALENERDEARRRRKPFSMAVIFLQVAVLLNSIAGLLKMRGLFWLAMPAGFDPKPAYADAFQRRQPPAVSVIFSVPCYRARLMRSILRLVYGAVIGFAVAAAPLHAANDPAWTTPLPQFQIADNLYYVGSRDLAAYLVVTSAGNILINANLQSSPPQIRASVKNLGFRWQDTKILLNGQAHYDHVAGAEQVLRETGAQNYVIEYDAEVMRSGGRSDFAFGSSDGLLPFPPTRVDRVLHDGDTVTLGGVTLTAHRTGGHTRGCTTWTMRAHLPKEPAGKLRDVVIVGGWAPLSQYRLVATPGQPASYPGIAEDFERTFATLRELPCDIFLGSHGVYFDMLQKRARMKVDGAKVWVDPQGYQAAVAKARENFAQVLAKQQAAMEKN